MGCCALLSQISILPLKFLVTTMLGWTGSLYILERSISFFLFFFNLFLSCGCWANLSVHFSDHFGILTHSLKALTLSDGHAVAMQTSTLHMIFPSASLCFLIWVAAEMYNVNSLILFCFL